MVQYEMVLELREFLSEHVYTCFFTNYYFEHAGQRLNDYTELAELNLQEDSKILMKPEKYDEKNARSHIKRVKDILSTPQLLSSTPSQTQLPSSVAKAEGEEESKTASN
jgi:Mitochondrial function, CLU-N-term